MFAKIAAFEFRYQLRQPAFWVIAIIFTLFSFGLVAASDNISLGGGGNVKVNAPYALAQAHSIFSILFMLATTAIVANVVARDASTGFGPMIQASQATKFDYLYGRFTGAFAAVALCFLSVSIGILLGTFMPWVDKETIGPFSPGDYAWAYLVMGLPGVFLTSALFFALATVTRSMMATYVGVVAVFIVYISLTSALARPEFEQALAWLEPFGASAYGLVTRYWTPLERNTLNPALEGVFLYNRLIWTGVALVCLAAAYVLYRPAAKGAKLRKQDRLRALAEKAGAPSAPAGALPTPSYGAASGWAQLRRRTGFEMALIFKSPAFLVLLVLGAFQAVGSLLFAGEIYGAPVFLVTRLVIELLQGAFGLVAIIVAIYYAGELVWRDRERRTHEIIDATPTPDWTFLVPKTLALILVLGSILVVGMLTGMAVQTYKGGVDYEIGKYVLWLLIPGTVNFAFIAVLAIFVQSLSPNKFVGWALMVVYLVGTIVLSNLGFEHVLYRYGGGVGGPLSDMNGTGDFGTFGLWTDAYWTAFATILLVLAYALWRRGTESRLLPRLRRLPRRLAGPAGAVMAVAALAFVGLGGFIFYNTNILNDYETSDQQERRSAEYEKTFLRFEDTPQPSVVTVVYDMDLDPHAPRLVTKGSYVVENRTGAPLSEMHLRWVPDLEVTRMDVEGATVAREWDAFDYRIYRFATPMAPGERRTVRFETVFEQKGFKHRGNTTRLVDNGTFVSNTEFAPMIGMSRQGLLSDRTTRRKYGLPAELRQARLEDTSAQGRNYIGADWVNADITVTTVADQTPIAPGYKVSDVTRDGRRTARFVTEAPILNFLSVQSARYEVEREVHDGIELAVYHHPGHERNVSRMMASLKTGLDYFQTAFGPYQFRQVRIIEFPAYATFAQAFANTIPYSESLGFIADFRDPEKIDYVTYITAHELGHQWWAHQVVSANSQGSTTLTETLAQYSALMVMKQTYGADQIRRFLKFELDNYLRSRGTERLEELPLYRVENQGYIHYQKGGSVMYLLADQIGEDRVNAALRSLIQRFAFQGAPYPRSLDLIAALRAQAPADKQALITDLFERITLYDVKVTETESTRRSDGRWDTVVTVEARKLYADGQGEETESPLNETFDVGLFSAEPGDGAFEASDVLMFERRPLRSGVQTFRFTTAQKPTFAGVDPYNKWIDRNSDDNIRAVE